MLAYPWLAGMVFDIPDFHSCFLPQLTLDGIFERLPGFHKTRKSGIDGTIPFRLVDEGKLGRSNKFRGREVTHVSPE